MAYLYKQVDVTVPPGEEGTRPILTSTTAEPKRIVDLCFQDATVDLDFLAFIEREKFVDLPTESKPAQVWWMPVNRDLPVGETLEVGYRNGTTASITKWVVAKYEIIT